MQLRLKKNVFLVKSVAEDVPMVIESDNARLKQILINILRNSTKFTFKGYIQISARPEKILVHKQGIQIAIIDAV